MNNWYDEWNTMLDTMTIQVERFCQDVAKDLAEATDALIEFSDEVAEQIHQAITPVLEDMDEQVQEWLEPMLLAFMDLDTTFSEVSDPITHTVDPILNQHPVCVGCRHYHGQSYNGVMLVCGMHPYGMEGDSETCPDKETIEWRL